MKTKILTAALAALFMFPFMTATTYAGGGEDEPAETVTETAVQEAEPNPFTPDGTGTVVDTATDEEGKEFYTIVTPDENVFYLIIDNQRTTENVYFLNAVTEADLMALAVPSESVSAIADGEGQVDATTPETDPDEPEDTPTDEQPTSEPGQKSNMPTILLVAVIVLGGGGAGYYFKVLRPKQQLAEAEEDTYNEYEDEADLDVDPYDEDTEDDSPPWDTDESEGEDE